MDPFLTKENIQTLMGRCQIKSNRDHAKMRQYMDTVAMSTSSNSKLSQRERLMQLNNSVVSRYQSNFSSPNNNTPYVSSPIHHSTMIYDTMIMALSADNLIIPDDYIPEDESNEDPSTFLSYPKGYVFDVDMNKNFENTISKKTGRKLTVDDSIKGCVSIEIVSVFIDIEPTNLCLEPFIVLKTNFDSRNILTSNDRFINGPNTILYPIKDHSDFTYTRFSNLTKGQVLRPKYPLCNLSSLKLKLTTSTGEDILICNPLTYNKTPPKLIIRITMDINSICR